MKTWEKIKEWISKKSTSVKIITVYSLTMMFVSALFYPLIPILLNYAPDSINNDFQVQFDKIYYSQQYLIIVLIVILIGYFFLRKTLKGIDEIEKNQGIDGQKIETINAIKKKCFNLPYIIYLAQIFIPVFSIILLFAMMGFFLDISTIKIVIIIFSFVTLAALISLMFSKRIFSQILLETFKNEEKAGLRISLRNKIFLQILPIFIVTILFTSLIGYSRIIKEKGDLLFEGYSTQLANIFQDKTKFKDISEIQKELQKINLKSKSDTTFVISPKGEALAFNGEKLSDFFIKYAESISPKYSGHVFDYYGVDIQGATIKLKNNSGDWLIGVKYEVASEQTIEFFLVSFITLLLLNIFVLSYFAKTLSEDISMIANNLSDIAEGGAVEKNEAIPVTSNDEIGDLVIAFNKIQELEKENIKSLKENQSMLMERERLASLGQLIGGIAHNLKTPIMSMAGGFEALEDLVKEYDESIEDKEVTPEDHHEIAKEMAEWVGKLKPYLSYMSDVITTVKDQAVQLNDSTSKNFTLDEVIKRVDILMKHELKQYYCKLNMSVSADINTLINGEANNLVQVFNNLITNAIYAYDGKGGEIDFTVVKKDNNIEFKVKDYGKGISDEVKDRLFKEMVTTKGKNGTGLGLYMSYSTIKGRFGGDMWFETEPGKGTTFYITIPISKDVVN